MAVELRSYQMEAVDRLKNGCILCGGVGSGKSITALYYYVVKECGGKIRSNERDVPWNIADSYAKMTDPRDLYIITTAKKRDSLEWDKECAKFCLSSDREISHSGVKVTIDSWNNIGKYRNVYGAFFIFDEQRVVGSGAWVKAFLNIARKNRWILLSATPGDQWKDYIPVFVANGFYRNKTDFTTKHCIYNPHTSYPSIKGYMGEKILRTYRDRILVTMEDDRDTVRINIDCPVEYDKVRFMRVFRDRWDPYEEEPIEETGKLMFLLRRVVNEDPSRIEKLDEIFKEHPRIIVYYTFVYELELLRGYCERCKIKCAEWNGQKHEDLPSGESWIYLVQYTAGSEGWNCITTDTIVFYSLTYSYRILEQASGRIDRINTPYKELYYYHLYSYSQIDTAIRRALRTKKMFNEASFLKRGGFV